MIPGGCLGSAVQPNWIGTDTASFLTITAIQCVFLCQILPAVYFGCGSDQSWLPLFQLACKLHSRNGREFFASMIYLAQRIGGNPQEVPILSGGIAREESFPDGLFPSERSFINSRSRCVS